MNTTDKKFMELDERVKSLEEKVERIVRFIDGRYDANESKHYGGLTGFGGELGRLDWLQNRLNRLTDTLDQRFKSIGEKMGWQEMVYVSSLSREIDEPKGAPSAQKKYLP